MVNSVVMVGRLTRDPELRRTTSGSSVASFTLACDDSRRGPNGEKTTVFITVSVFGQSADSVVKYTRKGSLVGVVGRITQRKYTNRNNVEVTATEIVANQVEFLDPKGAQNNNGAATNDSGRAAPANQPMEDSGNTGPIDIVDDDLPF